MATQYHAVNSEALQQQFADDKKGGGDNAWLKLTTGTHTLRLAPPFGPDGIPYRKCESFPNLIGPEGRKIAPVAFDFLFSSRRLSELAVKAKKITKVDFELWKKHGDPMRKLAESVANIDKEAAKKLWPRKVFYFNVLNRQDGTMKKWQQSKKFFETVETQFKLTPSMFDPTIGYDFMITATGDGINRRYSSPIFIQNPAPLNFEGELHDLDDVIIKGVYTYHQVLESMATTAFVQAGVALSKFDIKSFLS